MLSTKAKFAIGVTVLVAVVVAIVVPVVLLKGKKIAIQTNRISIKDPLKITSNFNMNPEDLTIRGVYVSTSRSIGPREVEFAFIGPGSGRINIKDQKDFIAFEVVPRISAEAKDHTFDIGQKIELVVTFNVPVTGDLSTQDIEVDSGLVSSVSRINTNKFKIELQGLATERIWSVVLKDGSLLKDEFGYPPPPGPILLAKVTILTPDPKITQTTTQVQQYLPVEFEIEFAQDIWTEPKVGDLKFYLNGVQVLDQGSNSITRNNRFLTYSLNPQNIGDLKIVIPKGTVLLASGSYSRDIDLFVTVISPWQRPG